MRVAAFCAGGDVKGMAARENGNAGAEAIDEAIARQRLNQRATAGKLFTMPKPTIAALPGPAAGAGLALALACDLRVMANTAIMTTAFARVGFSGDYGGTYFLTQLVGSAKAREMYYLSDRIAPEEALRLGLANWICAPDELAAKTREVALRLAQGPTVAYRYMKENLNRAMAGNLDDCMDLEATHHIHCGQTEDHRDASRAFVEKRPPRLQRPLIWTRPHSRNCCAASRTLAVAGDGAAFAACFTEDGIYHDYIYGDHTGHAAISHMLTGLFLRDAEQYHWQMSDAVCDGDTGYAWSLSRFVSKIPQFAGQTVVIDGTSRFALRDGLIAAYHESVNGGVAMVQLGVEAPRIEKVLRRWAKALRERPEGRCLLQRGRQVKEEALLF